MYMAYEINGKKIKKVTDVNNKRLSKKDLAWWHAQWLMTHPFAGNVLAAKMAKGGVPVEFIDSEVKRFSKESYDYLAYLVFLDYNNEANHFNFEFSEEEFNEVDEFYNNALERFIKVYGDYRFDVSEVYAQQKAELEKDLNECLSQLKSDEERNMFYNNNLCYYHDHKTNKCKIYFHGYDVVKDCYTDYDLDKFRKIMETDPDRFLLYVVI